MGKGLGTAGYLVELVLINHILGLVAFGRFSLVVAFVTLVGQFFDVRVEQATLVFGGERIKSDPGAATGVLQFSYLVDLGTGALGFLAIIALLPLMGVGLVGEGGGTLILIYALTLLASTVDGTSSGTLQLLDRHRQIVWYTLGREALRVLVVAAMLVRYKSLFALFVGILIHDAIAAVIIFLLAAVTFRREMGTSLISPVRAGVDVPRKQMIKMIFHTNLVAYARLVQMQVPALVLGFLHGPLDVGLYKLGAAAGLAVGALTDPFSTAILPRLSRLWARGQRDELRQMLKQISAFSFAGMGLALLLIVFFREPILVAVGGNEARSAATILTLVALAQAVNGALFWNGPVLMAMHRASVVARIQLLGVSIHLPLLLSLSYLWGANGAAVALVAAYLVINVGMTIAALRFLATSPHQGVSEPGQSL